MTALSVNPRAEAEQLLEAMFKAGAQHLYIFDRMKAEAATKKVLAASPPVNVELLLILVVLARETATASSKTAHQKGARKAQELIPGLKNWSAPRSDWLGSGVERVPLSLVPLLLRRRAAWTDDSLATALTGCRVAKHWTTLAYHRPIIQAFVAHVDSFAKRNGLGTATTAELSKLQVKLSRFATTQYSQLATWAKHQANRLGTILQREA